MSKLEGLLYLAPIVLASLTLHELAHAWVAWKLGDPTAKDEGRLTPNPLVHVDPFGAAMFVLTYILTSVPFGWARPVPVDPRYFRRAKEGMALVAAAGPATNFLLALACLAVLRHAPLDERAFEVGALAYIVNVILGRFNLIPIPPLDGSRIVGVFMDNATYSRWVALDQVGMLIVFGVFFLFRGEFSTLLTSAVDHVTRVMNAIVLG